MYNQDVIDFLVLHQSYIKEHLTSVNTSKDNKLTTVDPIFRQDVLDQYNDYITSWICNYVCSCINIQYDEVMIQLELIDLDDYLNI